MPFWKQKGRSWVILFNTAYALRDIAVRGRNVVYDGNVLYAKSAGYDFQFSLEVYWPRFSAGEFGRYVQDIVAKLMRW